MEENLEELMQINRELAEENMRFKRMLAILGSIWFYGDFKAETVNERELEVAMIQTGFRFRSEDEVVANLT